MLNCIRPLRHAVREATVPERVAAITRAEIEALIAEGVRYLQLDNPGYGRFVGSHGGHGSAVAGVTRPAGVTIGLHVCRGNQASMWMGEGDYDPIAERLFRKSPSTGCCWSTTMSGPVGSDHCGTCRPAGPWCSGS